jgi:hypothetical protein
MEGLVRSRYIGRQSRAFEIHFVCSGVISWKSSRSFFGERRSVCRS